MHCIVTGGAYQPTADGERWQAAPARFLFPVVKLSRDYRDRFCEGLLRLYRAGKLKLEGACEGLDVAGLVAQMQTKAWEVFSRPAFEGAEGVLDDPSASSGQAWRAT